MPISILRLPLHRNPWSSLLQNITAKRFMLLLLAHRDTNRCRLTCRHLGEKQMCRTSCQNDVYDPICDMGGVGTRKLERRKLASLSLDARKLDHFGPLGCFFGNEFAEVGG